MRRRLWLSVVFVGFVLMQPFCASAEVLVGEVVPDFTLSDTQGQAHSLSDHRGDLVVLEWTNYECPFVRKHYDSANMQGLQKKYTGAGITWYSVCSSAPGKQGYFAPDRWNQLIAEKGAMPSAVLLDPAGDVGRMYEAKTTPHMYIIGPDGRLLYKGAIDNKPSVNPADIQKSKNYVSAALEEVLAGKSVSFSETRPYGCSVKY